MQRQPVPESERGIRESRVIAKQMDGTVLTMTVKVPASCRRRLGKKALSKTLLDINEKLQKEIESLEQKIASKSIENATLQKELEFFEKQLGISSQPSEK